MEERAPLVTLDKNTSMLLKGIAILYVLLVHLHWFYCGGGGVALFLILGGYGLKVSCEEKGLAGYWCNRLRKVWIPYVFVGILDVFFFALRGKREILCTVLGLDLGLGADRTMWYISYILVWYLLFYLVIIATRRISRRILRETAVIAGLTAGAFAVRLLCHKGFWHPVSAAELYLAFFPLGVLLGCLRRLTVPEKLRRLIWLAVLFAATAYVFYAYGMGDTARLALAVAAQPFALLQLVQPGGRLKESLLWLGKYSYPCYLFEGIFLNARNAWFAVLEIQPAIDAAFLAATLVCAVAYWKAYSLLEETFPLRKLIRF